VQTFECVSCQRECRTYARSPRCVCGKQMTAKEAGPARAAPAVIVGEWAAPDKFDIVTVTHNDRNRREAAEMREALDEFSELPYTLRIVDNRRNSRTYAAACNSGAAGQTAPVIGFINPDVEITGPFMRQVAEVFDTGRHTVITGERFGKSREQVREWGLLDWTCGAAMFVRREWFGRVGGFDERYAWAWEETDICMQAQRAGYVVRSIQLPMWHESPTTDTTKDLAFKRRGFEMGQALYRRKWHAG